jgi:hypothetical protein
MSGNSKKKCLDNLIMVDTSNGRFPGLPMTVATVGTMKR